MAYFTQYLCVYKSDLKINLSAEENAYQTSASIQMLLLNV